MNDRTRVSGDSVTCATRMFLLDNDGSGSQIDADLRYDPDDPFAVSVVFHTAAKKVTWTFARELLIEGVYEPAGIGDVQIWPCLEESGSAVVMIELFAPAGGVMLQAASRAVAGFVAEMLEAVPLGAEQVDLDAAVAALR